VTLQWHALCWTLVRLHRTNDGQERIEREPILCRTWGSLPEFADETLLFCSSQHFPSLMFDFNRYHTGAEHHFLLIY
jgi:hypothetical protein